VPGESPSRIDAAGRFQLALHAGRAAYELLIYGLEEPYGIIDISYNGSKLPGTVLTPYWNALDHALEVVISDEAPALDGSVYSGEKPVGGARVIIAPWPLQLKGSYPIHETSSADENGRFRKGGLRPGTSLRLDLLLFR
jgi:hypothetical protein